MAYPTFYYWLAKRKESGQMLCHLLTHVGDRVVLARILLKVGALP